MPSRERRLREEQARIQQDDVPVPPALPSAPQEMPMASAPDRTHWVRFVIPGQGAMTYHGTDYDYGALLAIRGTPRDEQLVRLGFLAPLDQSEAHLHAQCGVCAHWFLTEYFRDMHGRRRHQQRFVGDDLDVAAGMAGPDGGAALRDITGDAEERRLMQENPLFLEKTKASQQG